MADEKTTRFESMAAMARELAPTAQDHVLEFPLRDDSGAQAWMSCADEQRRKGWAAAWLTKRKNFEPPLETRDFLAIAAYEADGAKMERSFGWSALSMWLSAAREARVGEKTAGLDKKAVLGLLPKLLETGASMEAFQAAHPNALSQLIEIRGVDGEPYFEAAVALLDAGWNPNAWDPATEPRTASSMQAALRSMPNLGCESLRSNGAKPFEPEVLAARWMELLRAAQKRGFDLDSRSMDGRTALGMCCEHKGYAGEKLAEFGDPRVMALMELGADTSKASRFWLAAMESDPLSQKAAAAAWERSQLAGGLARPGQTKTPTRAL